MKRTVALIALFAAGCAAALALGATRASAWDIGSLPPGYSIGIVLANVGPNECASSYVISGYGATTTIGYGKAASGYDCNPSFQSQLDAFINATYVAPVTTTVPAADTTTTAPSDTGTTTSNTTATPAAPAQTVTVTTPDPAVTVAIADLQAQITELRVQVSKLVAIVEQFPNLDPAILAALMALAP